MKLISVPSPVSIFDATVPFTADCISDTVCGVNTLVITVRKIQSTKVKAQRNLKLDFVVCKK